MLSAISVSVGAADERVRRAVRSLESQGFEAALSFRLGDVALLGWSRPNAAGGRRSTGPRHSVRTPHGFACCVGPVWYRGRFGAEALRRILDDIDDASVPAGDQAENSTADAGALKSLDFTQLRGSFALFVQKGEQLWLLNDPTGFLHVYASEDSRFLSTSWLAARAYVARDEIDDDAAIEYVLQGASHSEQTVAAGVHKLELGYAFDLRRRRRVEWIRPDAWASPTSFRSLDEAVEALVEHLRTVFTEIASSFHERTRAALSGGFDSRMIVAALLDRGERPDLFVYGDADSNDVSIAREIAKNEGLRIEPIDKDAVNRQFRRPDVEELVRCALFFDGLPNDGIHDPGADRRTRLAQSAQDHIALNGGGGEIFRNFFHLTARRFEPENVVHAFYRGFDGRALRKPRALHDYTGRLAESIARSVGGTGADGRLDRAQLERVYPLFRCHHWMGLNNSLAVRLGWFTTPLVDLTGVRIASSLPLAWKNAGALQSRLIHALHPGIARYPSSYGFRFSEGPDAGMLRADWATRIRPVFARPLINATRRRLYGLGVSADRVARFRRLFPGAWRVDRSMRLEHLPDDGALERALSIEVVSRELAP